MEVPVTSHGAIVELQDELRLAPKALIVTFVVLGLVLSLMCDSQPDSATRIRLQLYSLLFFVSAGSGWLLEQWWPNAVRWFLVTLTVGITLVGIWWLGERDLALLTHLPVVAAMALAGLGGGLVAAVGETVLFMLLWNLIPLRPSDSLFLPLLCIWGTLAAMVAVSYPANQLTHWFWAYFQRVQVLVEEARERKMQLEHALEDLAHANRQLALTNERLGALRLIAEEAQKAKAAFVAKVSHEFRTPLNMIIGLVDLMVKTPEIYGQELPPALVEDLNIVYRSCRHLAAMVNDVLALSQAEAGRLVLYREWVDVVDVVREALDVVRPLIEKKGLTLAVDVAAEIPKVYCDKTRIRQVVLNLLSNAARFTETGGISVRVMLRDGRVIVHVSDTGPGIAPEEAEHIFEPFTQASGHLWRDTGGSGLGLSISKQFVELHGGRIWLESAPGAGSTFSFELPVSPPILPVAGPTRWISEEWPWRERRSRSERSSAALRPRVIVCDCDDDLATLLEHTVGEGIEIAQTRDIEALRTELRACPAHAVLVNVSSPAHMWTTVHSIRREIQDTPIFGCTIRPRLEHVLRAGACEYLVKPVERHHLEQALCKGRQPVRRVLIVDDDPDVLHLWELMLRACDGGLEIITATSGSEALAHLQARHPDLVLLDVLMPDMDGWEVLERKRRDATLQDIPVVLVSAQDLTEQPVASDVLLVTIGGGIPLNKLVRCCLSLSAELLRPG